jgi:hypothetical protein
MIESDPGKFLQEFINFTFCSFIKCLAYLYIGFAGPFGIDVYDFEPEVLWSVSNVTARA